MTDPIVVGRYTLHQPLAAGGMATVYLGRLSAEGGFSRTVAVKRLHPQFAADPEFVAGFMDEARLAGRIRHPNVVSVIDVVSTGDELLLVMEYIHGESLARVLRKLKERGELVSPPIAAAIMCNLLDGLHAAHEARDESGAPLGIVHRDVSPQNVLIGADGVAHVLDFGIAKAKGRQQEQTREGQLKGKLAYMAPEQLDQQTSRSTDVYAASVVFWEMLTCSRLMQGETEGQIVMKILAAKIPPPSSVANVTSLYDDVVLKGLATNPAMRFATAREMSIAIGKCGPRADAHEVAEWLETIASEALSTRANVVSAIESTPAALRAEADAATRSDLARDAHPTSRSSRTIAIVVAGAAVAGVALFAGLRQKQTIDAGAPARQDPMALEAAPPSAQHEPTPTATTTSATAASASANVTTTARPPARKPASTPTASQKLPDFL